MDFGGENHIFHTALLFWWLDWLPHHRLQQSKTKPGRGTKNSPCHNWKHQTQLSGWAARMLDHQWHRKDSSWENYTKTCLSNLFRWLQMLWGCPHHVLHRLLFLPWPLLGYQHKYHISHPAISTSPMSAFPEVSHFRKRPTLGGFVGVVEWCNSAVAGACIC